MEHSEVEDTRPAVKREREEDVVDFSPPKWDKISRDRKIKRQDIIDELKLMEDPYMMSTGFLSKNAKYWKDGLQKEDYISCATEAYEQLKKEYQEKFPGDELPDEKMMKKAAYFLTLSSLEWVLEKKEETPKKEETIVDLSKEGEIK